MGMLGHVGTFLCFAAFILLLICSLSAPIIDHIGFLNVHVGSQVTRFGAWGWCQTTGNNRCSQRTLGYDLGGIIGQLANEGSISRHALTGLTKTQVLVPVACGLAGLTWIVALISVKLGYLVACILAALSFIVSLVIMVINFSTYGIAKNDTNAAHLGNVHAEYGSAMWMLLAATLCLLLAVFFTALQTCFGRREKRRRLAAGDGVNTVPAGRTSRWGRKRNVGVAGDPAYNNGHTSRWRRSSEKSSRTSGHTARDAAVGAGAVGMGAHIFNKHSHESSEMGSGMGTHPQQHHNSHTARDAAVGGVLGSLVGHHGKGEHHTGRDAAIGATAGGLVGHHGHNDGVKRTHFWNKQRNNVV